ncbi:spermidine synthase [Legionella sp. km772]|uniref:spermidine synthase n=1 Tax=Legionella sp. km772 TaxID=2498111 RepID=UPI000F8DF691|nr:hypothetical protein [Legionella sp. km772]RUR10408.1 hypothetical protein ELY15_08210 [Legionella sp. km772]
MRWFIKFGKCIHTSASGYKVYDAFMYRWLTLDSNVLQTIINKFLPKSPVLYYIPALSLMARTFPDDSCVLGLGGAGLIHKLAALPSTITVVEISSEIITIAKKYFMIDTLSNLKLIHQPAEIYLAQTHQQFGHLMVDLYDAHSFPEQCNNSHFFLQCKRALKPNGFLAVNLANSKEQYAIFQLIKEHFAHTLVIPIKKCANMVIIASNHQRKEDFFAAVQQNKEIKKISLMSYWSYVADY